MDVVDRQSADDGGAAAQPQAAPARDDGLRAVAGRRRSHLLRLQPAADGVALHPSGLDLRRHPLPALSLLLLRQRRRLGPQYGPHHRQPVSPSILSFLYFFDFFSTFFRVFFCLFFFGLGEGNDRPPSVFPQVLERIVHREFFFCCGTTRSFFSSSFFLFSPQSFRNKSPSPVSIS